ncbi:MAG: hypothetical protein ACN4GZ_07805 [Acidimicrobiales bacterium]
MRRLARVISICAVASSLFLLFSSVEVSHQDGQQRNCGSVFDSLVDRSGWEQWWALDLDDPDERVRTGLLRTTQCPTAVNRQLGVALGLGALAALPGALHRTPRGATANARSAGSQLTRLGRTTSIAGAVLLTAGVVSIIVLTADADSTLFLYTDRIVVAVIGLVVLVPTLALFAIGRVLMLVGPFATGLEPDPVAGRQSPSDGTSKAPDADGSGLTGSEVNDDA